MTIETSAQENWEAYLAKCGARGARDIAKLRQIELETIINYQVWERKAYNIPVK